MESIINIHNSEFRYDWRDSDAWRLRIPNFEMFGGQVVLLTGDNMSGKSTFIRLISGMVNPSRAISDIKLNGAEFASQKHLQENSILLSSDDPMFPELSIWENIQLGLKEVARKNVSKAYAISNAMLGDTGIFEDITLNARLASLSSGARALVKLARGAVSDSPLVIVDEISSFLDRERAAIFLDCALAQLRIDRGLLIVSHNDRDREYITSRANAVLYHISREANISTLERKNL